MTKIEFAQRVKEKYPEYTHVPDIQLANRVLEKYPEYRSRIDPQELAEQPAEPGFARQLPKIAGATIGGMAGAAVGGIPGGIAGAGLGALGGEQVYRVATGEPLPRPLEAGRIAATYGASEAIGGAVGRGTVKLGKAAMPTIFNTMQGIPGEATKWALERGGSILKKVKQENPALVTNLINTLASNIRTGRKLAGQRLEKITGDIAEKMGDKWLDLRPVVAMAEKEISNWANQAGAAFARTPGEVKMMGRIYDTLHEYGMASLKNTIQLRRSIDSLVSFGKPTQQLQPISSDTQAILMKIASGLNEEMYKAAPALKKANRAFSNISKLYDEAQGYFSGTDLDTKILGIFKRGSYPRAFLQNVEKRVAGEAGTLTKIFDEIARREFAHPFKRSIQWGPMAAAGMVTGAVVGGGPGLMAGAAITPALLGISSPRLAGWALRGAEGLGKWGGRGGLPYAIPASLASIYEQMR